MLYEVEKIKIIQACKYMQKINYFLGTWGNISVRINDHIILTPSKIEYDIMTPEDMVVIDINGNIVEATQIATSEKEVHRRIYEKHTTTRAIIHAHPVYAVAVSTLLIDEIPTLSEEMSQLLGGSISLTTEYIPAEKHSLLGQLCSENIGEKNGLIVRNHGSIACGKDLDEAILVARVLEKSCKIYLLTSGLKTGIIPNEYVKSERYRFLYKYGNELT